MYLLFGQKQKPIKQITLQFTSTIDKALNNYFCNICHKNSCAKVAFGEQTAAQLCCSACQLKAVQNKVSRLNERHLLPIKDFSFILTKQLIAYSTSTVSKFIETDQLLKVFKEKSEQIKEEYKFLKQHSKSKTNDLLQKAKKQNTFPIFQEVKSNKTINEQTGRKMAQSSMMTKQGLTFINLKQLNQENDALQTLLNQMTNKINLRDIRTLIVYIDSIKL